MAGQNNAELNALLKWGITNSDASGSTNQEQSQAPSGRGLNAQTLNALLGGPTDADLMRANMQKIESTEVSLDDRITAFDNLEQLVESIDNANQLESLSLWTPLLKQLDSPEIEMRKMAAWCVGTAVQNNVKSQERLLAMDGVGKLAKMAVQEADAAAKKKSIYALSSSMRNYQPATNEALKFLPQEIVQAEQVPADDMDKIDEILNRLRD